MPHGIKNHVWPLAVLIIFASIAGRALGIENVIEIVDQGESIRVVEHQIIVRLESPTKSEGVLSSIDIQGMTVLRSPDERGVMLVSTSGANRSSRECLEVLSKLSDVKYAHFNQVGQLTDVPGDTAFWRQWYLHNLSQTPPGGTTDADIDLPEARELSKGSSSITIGVLDTGLPMDADGNLTHPDLDDASRFLSGRNFIDTNLWAIDDHRHGTAVSGIIAAETSDSGIASDGIAGVAPNCKIIPLKVEDLSSSYLTDLRVYDAAIWAIDNDCNILNMSFAFQSSTSLQREYVEYAAVHSVLIVAAGGNNGGGCCYPAKYSLEYANVIAVSATDQNDQIASYSSIGSWINICAPGGAGAISCNPTTPRYDEDDIFTTHPDYSGDWQFNGTCQHYPTSYGYIAGSSYSAPLATGVAALVLSEKPGLAPGMVRLRLESTAEDLGPAGYDTVYGYGRLNAYNALSGLCSGTDSDNDGFEDDCDNCPDDANNSQLDSDADFLGDACDPCPFDGENDADGDGYCASDDNCQSTYNPDQADNNSDGIGNACCCIGTGTGNVNYDELDEVNLTDLSVLIDHLFGSYAPLACPAEGNVNGDATVNLTDLTLLADHLFGPNFPTLSSCP